MVESREQWLDCYINTETGQISRKKPPNEVLPDGWTHVYYKDYDKFAYMELETKKVVATIEKIPGYVPPQQQEGDGQENGDKQDPQEKRQEPAGNLQVTPSSGDDDDDDNDDAAAKQDVSQQSDTTESKKDEPADQNGHQEQSNPQPQQEPPQPQQTEPSNGEPNIKDDGKNAPESDKLPDVQEQQPPLQVEQSDDAPEDNNNEDKNGAESDKLPDAQEQNQPKQSDDEPKIKSGDENDSESDKLPDTQQQVEQSDDPSEDNNKDGKNDYESNKLPESQEQQQPEPSDDAQKDSNSDGKNDIENDKLPDTQQQIEPSDDAPEDNNNNNKNDSENDKLPDAQEHNQPKLSDDEPKIKGGDQNDSESDKMSKSQEQQQPEPSDDSSGDNNKDGKNDYESNKLPNVQEQQQQVEPLQLQVEPPDEVQEGKSDDNALEGDKMPDAQEQNQQNQPGDVPEKDNSDDSGGDKPPDVQEQQPPQPSPQNDLPQGWSEAIDPATGAHFFVNEVTTQQTTVRPPNEVLPDGWTHVYYEQSQRFAYMELGTKRVVASINDIPGYAPPQEPQQQSQESQQQQQSPQQPPQQSPQSDLPKGWIEEERDGVRLYGCESTGQWTQVKPPNEVLPDGWFHYYVEAYKRFGYANPSANSTVWNITDIPDYVPPQEPQQQQEGDGQENDDKQGTQEKQQEPAGNLQVTPSGGDDDDDAAAKQDVSQQSGTTEGKKDEPADQDGDQEQSNPQPQQEPSQPQQTEPSSGEPKDNNDSDNAPESDKLPDAQPQQPTQPSPQSDLPKGWVEKEQDGVHWYGCESTGQWTQVKPPNEVLPDGWTHVYYDEHQRFGYMELGTNKVVASIEEIPGYVPQSQTPQEQQPPQPSQPSQVPQQTESSDSEQKNANDNNVPDTQPQQPPQSDLPKGWVEKEQDGALWYSCEATGQQTTVKPPNEALPDGWFHYYVKQYKRFGYFNPSTQQNKWNITAIPGYVPPQEPQQPPQPSQQSDLPKGWVEKEQNGVRWYCCEPTGQWTQVKPPNEALPDGWTHVYYEQYQKFAYMKLGTDKVVATIEEIPGYVPPQEQQPPPSPPQPSSQSDLPKGWIEKEHIGIHWYGCEPTGQLIQVKPPNEVLPDGWFHYYVEQYKRFGYINPSTSSTVWNITAIPGYVPPQEQQQPPQPSTQSDLPKGWVEKEQDGVHWYGCEATGQWTQVKPPNEVLPDGWTHVYYEQYQKFAYMELGTNKVVASIEEIPGYVPQSQTSQEQQPPSPPQPSPQSDLPKGWVEKEQDGVHLYGCELTNQWIQVKPPNEVLPDGWFHYYVKQYKRFGYFNPSTQQNKWNITAIPGYVPPQEQQQQQSQQLPQPSSQSDLPKGWSEIVDPTSGAHFFINEVTTQQTTVKPPNEDLPDGWTHVYYEQYQKFAYMELGTSRVVASASDIYKYAHQ